MAEQKKWNLMLNNIKKTDKKYIVNITGVDSQITADFKLTRSQIGGNLLEAIQAINFSGGGTYPGSLGPVSGYCTMVDSNITRIEITSQALSSIRSTLSAGKGRSHKISGIKDYTYIYDIMPRFGSSEKYLKGKMISAIDGNTLKVKVTEVGAAGFKYMVPSKTDPGKLEVLQEVKIGDIVTVCLVGINCPETNKDSTDYESSAEDKNRTWLAQHGMEDSDANMKKAYAIAKEAKNFMAMWKDKTVTVDPDIKAPDYGHGEALDTYGRIIGLVYTDLDQSYLNTGYNAINLNVSLIANRSKADYDLTLAEPYYEASLASDGTLKSKFPLLSWWTYLPDYKVRMTAVKEKQKDKSTSARTKFLKDNNLSIDESGYVVYNGKRKIQVGTKSYTVKNNDTLQSIASKFDATIDDILATNSMPSYATLNAMDDKRHGIYTGLKLSIPKYETFDTGGKGDLWDGNKINNTNKIPADSENEEYVRNDSDKGSGKDYLRANVDDRDRLDGITSEYNPYGKYYLRIGDCMLPTSPLSIRVESVSSNRRIQPLRSKTSIQTQTGHSLSTLTIDLFFANTEAVNGHSMKAPVPGETWYRNGLRPLIAQFKRAPFLPIENELINDKFKIFSVALKDLNMSTIPGFPGCMQARLTLYEFDHTTYMPQEEYFAGTFSWPLYRWYYQRPMQKGRPMGRTYLKPIDLMDNGIRFYLPDEGILAQRQQAVKDLYKQVAPSLFKQANAKPGNVTADMSSDKNLLTFAKHQYNRFKKVLKKYPKSEYPLFYNDKGVFEPKIWDDGEYGNGKDIKCVEYTQKDGSKSTGTIKIPQYRYEHGLALYDIIHSTYAGDNMCAFFPNRTDFILYNLYTALRVSSGWEKNYGGAAVYTGIYDGNALDYNYGAEYMKTYSKEPLLTGYWGVNPGNTTEWPAKVLESGGMFILDLKSEINRRKCDPALGIPVNGEYKYCIDPSDAVRVKVMTQKSDAALSFINYELDYEKKNYLAYMNEADIPVREFPIGDIYIQDISCSMHNNYAPLQLNGNECPTFQYLGASDIEVELNIKTRSRAAVSRFRELMTLAQRMARDYRVAITSGVLTINCNLFAIMGVQNVLIEKLSIETSKEDKESFNINMTLVAFDKTQRIREDFEHASIGSEFETMEIFSAYSDERRNKSGFEYAAVDFKLRQLEVYPDMELPTYDEVNSALPLMNIKFADKSKFKFLPNPDNAKFVDPDFYIRCDQTFRDYVNEMLKEGELGLYKKCGLEFEGVEFGPTSEQMNGQDKMSTPDVIFSDDTLDWIKSNISEVNSGSAEDASSNGDPNGGTYLDVNGIEKQKYDTKTTNSAKATNSNTKATVRGIRPPLTPENKAAVRNKANVIALVTTKELVKWGLIPSAQDQMEYKSGYNGPKTADDWMKKAKDPSANDVINELIHLVKTYWPNLPSDEEALKSGDVNVSTYTYGVDRVSAPKITQEKVINVLKALLDQEHSWNHFSYERDSKGYPIPEYSPTEDIGIAQINAWQCGQMRNLNQARHAAWDWKYCLQLGIEYFAMNYNFAIQYGMQYGNSDAVDNPLDWAICCYNMGPVTVLKNCSSPQEVDYYQAVMKKFKNKYGADPIYTSATPKALYDKDVAKQSGSISAEYKLLLKVLKDAVDNPGETGIMMSYTKNVYNISDEFQKRVPANLNGYYQIAVVKHTTGDAGFTIPIINFYLKTGTHEENLPVLILDPQKQIPAVWDWAVDKGYQSKEYGGDSGLIGSNTLYGAIMASFRAKYDRDEANFNPKKNYILVNDDAAAVYIKAYTNKKTQDMFTGYGGRADGTKFTKWGDSLYKIRDIDLDSGKISEQLIEDMAEVGQERAHDPLINRVPPDDMGVLYRSSFDDMLQYDARGRLLRAFPTFQMFIVDEGRWMAWHKLWDNFYGYNSIVSIDLIKDRRIVADTALIEMTNIYHNLSTYDSDASYGEWDMTLADLLVTNKASEMWNAIWDLPDKDVIQARRDELNTMLLKPGARICLRMGYGANAFRLPTVFNGTISEMNTDEIVTIIAQGDGIELTNKLRVDPNTTNDPGIFGGSAMEPRDFICGMLTSKGSLLENLIDIGGIFRNSNPLGIMHFGAETVPTAALLGRLDIFQSFENYGEAGVNVYCGAGLNTMSQWIYTEGVKKGENLGIKWEVGGIIPWAEGDEPNVGISLFDMTPWDVIQTYAAACPDYVATVLPYDFRSTLFFGKPWWGVLDRYEYKYKWDPNMEMFIRVPVGAERRTLSQLRIYQSHSDILSNNIKASDQYMYTNVMGVYGEKDANGKGGKKTRIMQADSDIYDDKQKTAIVHLPLSNNATWGTGFWTQDKYAEACTTSALRDFIKDMYQGELLVMGDPTVKPFDKMFISDTNTEMNGMAEVKRVVHHFSVDTGFVTSITPDCITIVDDRRGISLVTWLTSLTTSVVAFHAGIAIRNKLWRKFWRSPIGYAMQKYGAKGTNYLFNGLIADMAGANRYERIILESMGDAVTTYITQIGKGLNKGKISNAKIKAGFKTIVEEMQHSGKIDEELLKEAYHAINASGETITLGQIRDSTAKIMRNNKTFATIDDKVLTKLSEIVHKTATAIKEGQVGKNIDEFWNASKLLKGEATLFKNSGLLRKTGNKLFKGTSRLAKFTLKTGGKASATAVRGASAAMVGLMGTEALAGPPGWVAIAIEVAIEAGLTILSASLVESYGRFQKSRQAVTILPLKWRGKPFTAGLNGHRGIIAGEQPSALDKFFAGSGFGGDAISFLYDLMGVDVPDYFTTEESAAYKAITGGEEHE